MLKSMVDCLANAQHLVSAALKLVRHLFHQDVKPAAAKIVNGPIDVRGWLAAQCKQREDAHLCGHPAHLGDGILMKSLAQLGRIEKQEVRTEREIERRILEGKRGKLRVCARISS
jgi:hypothetical protein